MMINMSVDGILIPNKCNQMANKWKTKHSQSGRFFRTFCCVVVCWSGQEPQIQIDAHCDHTAHKQPRGAPLALSSHLRSNLPNGAASPTRRRYSSVWLRTTIKETYSQLLKPTPGRRSRIRRVVNKIICSAVKRRDTP